MKVSHETITSGRVRSLDETPVENTQEWVCQQQQQCQQEQHEQEQQEQQQQQQQQQQNKSDCITKRVRCHE
jgi:hypothetical protein